MPQPTPIDRQISRLSFFLRRTCEGKREVREHTATIEEGVTGPGRLLDSDVARIQRVCTQQG